MVAGRQRRLANLYGSMSSPTRSAENGNVHPAESGDHDRATNRFKTVVRTAVKHKRRTELKEKLRESAFPTDILQCRQSPEELKKMKPKIRAFYEAQNQRLDGQRQVHLVGLVRW